MNDPRNYGAPSTFEIYGSSIEFVGDYNGGLMYLENSTVQIGIEGNGAGSIVYGYDVTMQPGSQLMPENGGKYIELKTPGPPWRFVPVPISTPTSTFTPVP